MERIDKMLRGLIRGSQAAHDAKERVTVSIAGPDSPLPWRENTLNFF
jgi:hypothetical protein